MCLNMIKIHLRRFFLCFNVYLELFRVCTWRAILLLWRLVAFIWGRSLDTFLLSLIPRWVGRAPKFGLSILNRRFEEEISGPGSMSSDSIFSLGRGKLLTGWDSCFPFLKLSFEIFVEVLHVSILFPWPLFGFTEVATGFKDIGPKIPSSIISSLSFDGLQIEKNKITFNDVAMLEIF